MSETFNGQDWATHSVSLLLENTYELYFEGRELAQRDETGATLRDWVAEWFWTSTDEAVKGTRYQISRADFDRIDWQDIAASLAAE